MTHNIVGHTQTGERKKKSEDHNNLHVSLAWLGRSRAAKLNRDNDSKKKTFKLLNRYQIAADKKPSMGLRFVLGSVRCTADHCPPPPPFDPANCFAVAANPANEPNTWTCPG